MAIVIFVVACFFWCISYGHTLTKFVYDFRNMMHFEIFGASRVSAKYGKFLRIIVSICFGVRSCIHLFIVLIVHGSNK